MQQAPPPYSAPSYGTGGSTIIMAPGQSMGGYTYGGESEAVISILLFVFGFCFWVPWLIGAFCIRSPNPTARGFGVASAVCYCLAFCFVVIFIPIWVTRGPSYYYYYYYYGYYYSYYCYDYYYGYYYYC